MTRILFIAPTPSHPIHQGSRIRITQLANAFKIRGFTVDFFYYALDGLPHESVMQMREAWDKVHSVSTDGFTFRRSFPDRWGLDDWVGPAAVETARHLADSYDYDLVICTYVWCTALLEPFQQSKAKLAIDTQDAFGDRHMLTRSAGLTPHWYYTDIREEGRGFDRVDMVIAIQGSEGESFREYTRSPVRVIEFSMPVQPIAQNFSGKIKVGYLGSRNPWNIYSLEAFDALLAHAPDREELVKRFDFMVYGGVCKAIKKFEVLRLMGMVERVEHFYEDVDVVINPMIGGTGLKIKSVEALAFGRPLISTASGGAGLEHIHSDICLPNIEAVLDRIRNLNSFADVENLSHIMRTSYTSFHEDTERKIDEMLSELNIL